MRRADDCTLKVVLSLQCPPRQIVYAPTLDVGTTPGGSELVHAGAPTSCTLKGAANQPSPPLQWPAASDDVRAEALYVTLTHGVLAVRAPEVSIATPALATECQASAEGEGALRGGGVLRAADGSVRLRLKCTCTSGGATGPRLANITLKMLLPDFTSPVVTFAHTCA